jgi:poly(A) polymerase
MVSPKVLDQDPLRMLRAVRFMTTLQGFHLSEETITEIRKMPERLSGSAVERVREEMDRVMVSRLARKGLLLMEDLRLLRFIFPELLPLRGMDQGPHHHLDAFQHTLQAVREVDNIDSLTGPFEYTFKLDTEDRLVLSYSTLLHDIGKAEDRTEDEAGIPHFYGHEKTGVEMARMIMKRLTFPNRRAERINRLIRYHVSGLGLIQNGYTQKALRRILRRLGEDLPLHVLLFLADRRAAQGGEYQDKERRTIALGQALLDLYQEQGESILNLPDLIGGEDVMEVLEIPPGPAVGDVLDQVRNLQVDQVLGTREEALQYLQKLLEANELDS